jgi:predicted Fe-Mo cluster-binding NifX family protein
LKIAVPAQDSDLDAKIDMRFGRAKCFIVVDPDTWEFEVVDNKQNIQAPAGAGIQAAQIVADHGADVLIAGNCGPKAFKTLKAADIKVFTGPDGTIREAVNSYKNGELKPAEGANVDAHSGI